MPSGGARLTAPSRALGCGKTGSFGISESAGLPAGSDRASSTASLPGRLAYTLHFFALFQDNAGKLRSAATSLLVNISHPRFPSACAIYHESSHTECNCGWGEAPRCQRPPPLRVDGRPVLACGLWGETGVLNSNYVQNAQASHPDGADSAGKGTPVILGSHFASRLPEFRDREGAGAPGQRCGWRGSAGSSARPWPCRLESPTPLRGLLRVSRAGPGCFLAALSLFPPDNPSRRGSWEPRAFDSPLPRSRLPLPPRGWPSRAGPGPGGLGPWCFSPEMPPTAPTAPTRRHR